MYLIGTLCDRTNITLVKSRWKLNIDLTAFDTTPLRSQFYIVIIIILQIFIKRKDIIAKIKTLKNCCNVYAFLMLYFNLSTTVSSVNMPNVGRYPPKIPSLENDNDQQLQQPSKVKN